MGLTGLSTKPSMIAIRDQVDEVTESSRAFYGRLAARPELTGHKQPVRHIALSRPASPSRADSGSTQETNLAGVLSHSSQGIRELSSPLSD